MARQGRNAKGQMVVMLDPEDACVVLQKKGKSLFYDEDTVDSNVFASGLISYLITDYEFLELAQEVINRYHARQAMVAKFTGGQAPPSEALEYKGVEDRVGDRDDSNFLAMALSVLEKDAGEEH